MFYVYILKSKKDNKLYIGRTDNLNQRLKDHSLGKVTSTKHRRPLILVCYEAYRNREDSKKRESGLKKSGSVYMGLKKRIKMSLEN